MVETDVENAGVAGGVNNDVGVGKKTYVDTQYSMFINTYLKLGLKTCTWHQSRIHSFLQKVTTVEN